MRYVVVLMIGFALGAASLAVASPERQTRPERTAATRYCAGLRPSDVYSACSVVRNWCTWIAKSNIDDPQVNFLFENMMRSCPRAWRR